MNTPVRIDTSALHRRAGALQLTALPPLALYVHLPWCLKKCPYCDFNSHEVHGNAQPEPGGTNTGHGNSPAFIGGLPPEARYLDAIRADLEAALPLVWGRRVISVFIGGGTPSLFSPASIERLLADIRARLPLEPGCEITLEANPGTFERERFRAFRDAGVTRLSIGVQSFDDTKLQALGRVHDRAQAMAAIEEAARAFDTFNIDLMYALPGQSLADCEADVRQALAFEPPHLSVYHLTLEPNTRFALEPPKMLPDDDSAFEMLDRITELTVEAGLQRYEVSAYARPGHRCVHNLNYWQFGDYLGIGAGAHSKLSFAHRILRQTRWREPASYMAKALEGAAVSSEHEVSADELPFEYMLNALRLREGFELARFTERTGLPFTAIQRALEAAEAKGLIERNLPRAWPTERGFDFLSDLQSLFLPSR
ncbi:MAG: oxygen-independent coproporphyrinogen III oxidase-like protein [Methylibium sp.]|uniref:radical SAM family heme chaperone HemW n=1 Tax=Methylibium sp. TaxID=2067992 RepID=UPI00180697E4|nr:radical SAM family heme chaperone HemW [Methylibium sp.]MBA3598847.1 oxygen-independent coproporphyrinogen III oxidase-like protein [Methylibium sp.]